MDNWKEDLLDEIRSEMEMEDAYVSLTDSPTPERPGDAVSIKFPADNFAMYFYTDNYEDAVRDGSDVKGLASVIATEARARHAAAPNIMDKEKLRENLYCTIVNASENPEKLAGMPHEKMEDLAIVARCRVSDTTAGYASFAVTGSNMSIFEMTPEEIMEKARANTAKSGFSVKSLGETMSEMLGNDAPGEYRDEMMAATPPLFVLTNASKMDGAVAIAYPEVMEAAREKIGEDFYVLPSSKHEVLLVPESIVDDPKFLEEMVQEVNRTTVSDRDKLSDSVYFYDGKARSFSIIDTDREVKALATGIGEITKTVLGEDRMEKGIGRRR